MNFAPYQKVLKENRFINLTTVTPEVNSRAMIQSKPTYRPLKDSKISCLLPRTEKLMLDLGDNTFSPYYTLPFEKTKEQVKQETIIIFDLQFD